MATARKEALIAHCRHYVESRLDSSQVAIKDLQASANEETKSSAGDKYETGRAMIQIEIDKHRSQIQELMKQKNVIDTLAVNAFSSAQPGALVYTDQAVYFLSISAGKLFVEGEMIMCVSMNSPIGILLSTKKADDTFSFNNAVIKILKVE
jgi:hypothetical protein